MSENHVGSTVEEAVKSKNIVRLRSCLVTAIKMDPEFRSGDYAAKIAYIERNGINVFEPHQELPVEFRKPKNEWDEEYFFYHAEWVLKNFSHERIKWLNEIGQEVFAKTANRTTRTTKAKQQATFTRVPVGTAEQKKSRPSPDCRPKSSRGWFLAAIGIALVILGVVLFVKLV